MKNSLVSKESTSNHKKKVLPTVSKQDILKIYFGIYFKNKCCAGKTDHHLQSTIRLAGRVKMGMGHC